MTWKLDVEARQDIDGLFARYCHYVDHNQGDAWAALFTPDGTLDIHGLMKLTGTEQLRGLPAFVADRGKGGWRHQLTNMIVEPGDAPDTAVVSAYGLITNWTADGVGLVGFSDYHGKLRRIDGEWRITEMAAVSAAAPKS